MTHNELTAAEDSFAVIHRPEGVTVKLIRAGYTIATRYEAALTPVTEYATLIADGVLSEDEYADLMHPSDDAS